MCIRDRHAIFAVPCAYGFAMYEFKFKKTLFTIYIIFMMMPFQVLMLPEYMVLKNLGLINTLWAVILPGAFSTFPVFIMYNLSLIHIYANDGFTVQSSSDNGWAVYGVSGSSIEINGGTYNTAANKETVGTIYTLGNSLTVRNATINVGPDSVMNAYGIYSNAKEILIENVTVNAKYSIAVNLNNSLGKTTINRCV